MTRKDYVAVAAVIRNQLMTWERDANEYVGMAIECVGYDLADVFAKDNSRFERSMFLAACGLPE